VRRFAGAVLVAPLLLAGCSGGKPRPPRDDVPAPRETTSTHREVPETQRAQSERYRDRVDGGPDKSIDLASIPEPVPRAEPRSRYGNRSPYSVLGRSYRVLATAEGYRERGIASWYGNKFHGYMTSSLEPYDMYKYSAAHKSLPLPSYVRVTNLDNRKSVVVRVNDRGPFHDDRIIDLSYAAAVKIGVWPKGTARVDVQALMPGDAVRGDTVATRAPSPPSADSTVAPARGQLYLQIGSYAEHDNAQRAVQTLQRARLGTVDVIATEVGGKPVQRVRLGPLRDSGQADEIAAAVRRLGLGTPRLATE
jgi:rare lipoprotein A